MAEPPSVEADFVAFFTTMLPKAVATARRITGDRASAEDAAAEGLARAYVRWSKLRTVSYREAGLRGPPTRPSGCTAPGPAGPAFSAGNRTRKTPRARPARPRGTPETGWWGASAASPPPA